MTPVKPSNGFEQTQDLKPLAISSGESKADQSNENAISEQKTDKVFNQTLKQFDAEAEREICIKITMDQKEVTREVAAAEYDFFS